MLDLRRVLIARLEPAPYNPRVTLRPGMPGYERLKRSIEEFDLVQPIVWNERTGHVVAGHQRLEILKARGDTEVDAAVVSLPLEREQALNVALNNPNVGSTWDPGRLVELVGELAELPEFDATLTGFDPDELRDLVLTPVESSGARGRRVRQGVRRSRSEAVRNEADSAAPAAVVRVVLEVPPGEWEAVRPPLDEIIGEFRLRAHVALP